MKTQNLIMAGDIDIAASHSDDIPESVPFAIVIQFDGPEQVRLAMQTGTVDFTVFGGKPFDQRKAPASAEAP
jgi:hypothetical protein